MTEIKYITIPVRVNDDVDEEIVKELRDHIELEIYNSPMFASVVLDAVRRRPEIQIESKLL